MECQLTLQLKRQLTLQLNPSQVNESAQNGERRSDLETPKTAVKMPGMESGATAVQLQAPECVVCARLRD
jgi:hypothetical protein